MNKSELVDVIADACGSTKVAANKFVDAFVSAVTHALKKGDSVVLPGFGSFAVGHRAARTGRNPQTGKTINIKASRVAKFRVGKNLKETVK